MLPKPKVKTTMTFVTRKNPKPGTKVKKQEAKKE